MAITLALLALLIEAVFGYPDWLLRTIGHPVTWMGRCIELLDQASNREAMSSATRRRSESVASNGAQGNGSSYAPERLLIPWPLGTLTLAILASSLIAQRSLYDHVGRVADALEKESLPAARAAVSHVVGRDPWVLDEAGVARAAIESLAENFSDGIVAPAFWLAALGLPGGAVYKAINTADSMIGHRTPRHQAFVYAAARLDDLINLPASRLSAVLIVAAAAITRTASATQAWQAILRDAPHHRSPNAGYPEAAMAGALGVALAGPRVYHGVEVADAIMGNGRRAATAADVRAALSLYVRADAILIALAAALAILIRAG